MFYVELERFSSEKRNVFIVPMIATFDRWLYNIPKNLKRRFTPYDFSKIFEVPNEQVEHMFLDLVRNNILSMKYALCCNYCKDCKASFNTISEAIESFADMEVNCEFCKEDVEYFADDIYPIFTVNPSLTLNRDAIKKFVSGEGKSYLPSGYGSNLPELIEHCPEHYNSDDPEICELKKLLRKKVR